jgi:hypothetical protein
LKTTTRNANRPPPGFAEDVVKIEPIQGSIRATCSSFIHTDRAAFACGDA